MYLQAGSSISVESQVVSYYSKTRDKYIGRKSDRQKSKRIHSNVLTGVVFVKMV